MNCKWCDKELSKSQIYEFKRGKTKGTSCSSYCSQKLKHYKNKEDELKSKSKNCLVCGVKFIRKGIDNYKVCSAKCAGVLSSERMKIENPMHNEQTRQKVSETLKKIGHKPYIQGGNGRGATKSQLLLYNAITKLDDSFSMEYIERIPKKTRLEFKTPNHYKIDIASFFHKIAIEVDGVSHKNLKVKECDNRKNQVLFLRGWKVLRLSNSKIEKELESCVQMVMSMI